MCAFSADRSYASSECASIIQCKLPSGDEPLDCCVRTLMPLRLAGISIMRKKGCLRGSIPRTNSSGLSIGDVMLPRHKCRAVPREIMLLQRYAGIYLLLCLSSLDAFSHGKHRTPSRPHYLVDNDELRIPIYLYSLMYNDNQRIPIRP